LLARGSTVFRLFNWLRTRQINFKLDGAHPAGASHHQKIVVIDDNLAFCGGIDMTATRWDTREHRDEDKRRKRPTTGRPYCPWHDATMAVDGAAARGLGDLARERWKTAGGDPIKPPNVDSDPWPEELKPHFRNAEVALARTRGKYKRVKEVREIEALFVDMVRRARRFIYIENQFFASRVVAEEIAKRLGEADGPEFVVINPKVVEGWVEEEAMTPARSVLLMELAKADKHKRLRVYTPVTKAGCDIYVHSKIAIVDDRMLRVGSANLNNRSMGLDSECDVLIDADRPANEGASKPIANLLADLLGEHLGKKPADVARELKRSGSLVETIEKLRGRGRTLMPLEVKEPNAVETALAENEALDPDGAGKYLKPAARPGLIARLRRLLPGRRTAAARGADNAG
jgi:phospholipase D1/2